MSPSVNAATPWLPNSPKTTRLRLFCFPYAGGGAAIYREWAKEFEPDVEVCPVQLPGREARLREPAHASIEELLAAATPALAPWLDVPYAFFGHSMGATIAYELARRLVATIGKPPVHLFVSGSVPPGGPRARPIAHLAREQFIAELVALGGLPAVVRADQELLNMFLPSLRADFRLVDEYRQLPGPRLECPVTVFWARQDPRTTAAPIDGWNAITTGAYRSIAYEGDHFFIASRRKEVTAVIREALVNRQGAVPGQLGQPA